jgi:phosphoserine phosphatase RsbU/P
MKIIKENISKELDLNSLIEFSQIVNSNLNLKFILNSILFTVMGKMLISKCFILIKKADKFVMAAQKGYSNDLLQLEYELPELPKTTFFDCSLLTINKRKIFKAIKYCFKIRYDDQLIGLLCLNKKMDNSGFLKSESKFIETLINISSAAIENSLKFNQLDNLNKKLDLNVQHMRTLFELSNNFNRNILDEQKSVKVLQYSLQGVLGISKFDYLIFDDKIKDNTIENIIKSESKKKQIINLSDYSENKYFRNLYKRGFRLLIPVLNNRNKLTNIILLGKRLQGKYFSETDMDLIQSIVNIYSISLNNIILIKENIEKQKIENEIKLAKEIQNILLPTLIPGFKDYDIFGKHNPALEVGGDYFDIIEICKTKALIVIADVSGKGLPASLLMSNIQSAVHAFVEAAIINEHQLSEITKKLNRLIFKNTSSEKFITFFWGLLDTCNNTITYTNAGHNHPFLFNREILNKKVANLNPEKLSKGGIMLGIIDSFKFEKEIKKIEKGDLIFLYTDGITEAQNFKGEEFGEQKLIKLILKIHNLSAKEIVNVIIKEVFEFAGDLNQYDDQTLIVIKRK